VLARQREVGQARSKAVWSACTARSTASARTTQLMRMGDVEIISMLMPSVASV
jgi:hypothetical protein